MKKKRVLTTIPNPPSDITRQAADIGTMPSHTELTVDFDVKQRFHEQYNNTIPLNGVHVQRRHQTMTAIEFALNFDYPECSVPILDPTLVLCAQSSHLHQIKVQ